MYCADGKCSSASAEGITVNNQNSGTVISRTGELKASIKFFAWADKNQMPVKKVCVDYDNGIKSPACLGGDVNFYQNHRGWKASGAGASECDNTDFGRATQACTENYASYGTTYTCTRGGRSWTESCPAGTGVTGGCFS